MEETNILDIDNDIHLFALQYIYIPRINASLNTFQDAWNNHPLSSVSGLSPNQLWISGSHPSETDADVHKFVIIVLMYIITSNKKIPSVMKCDIELINTKKTGTRFLILKFTSICRSYFQERGIQGLYVNCNFLY